MRAAIFKLVTLVFASSISFAQLSIENPKHLKVPEDQARLLLRISCRAVADELHLRESSLTKMSMHLILGAEEDGFGYAEHTGVPTLSLREWDERKFVTAALSFAVQRSINQHRQEQIIADILHRYRQIGPISADHLHNSVAPSSRLL